MDRTAALFRLEHALSPLPAWRGALFLAGSAPGMRQRLRGLAGLALSRPMVGLDPTATRDLTWAMLKDLSEDRVEVLGRDWAVDHVLPTLRPEARRLVDDCRSQGRVLVLLSESITPIAAAVGAALGFDVVVSNTLTLRDGAATGALEPPVVGPEIDPRRLRALAAAHGFDLARSCAYGGAGADGLLLSSVGLPCAVDPDRALARVARDLDWPVLHTSPVDGASNR